MKPTIIEIRSEITSTFEDEESPYYLRTLLTPHISTTTKFDHVTYFHLGFQAWNHGLLNIRQENELHKYTGYLEPNMDLMVTIPPFKIKLVNAGDSFTDVHIRMKEGVSRCKVTILQEKYQPKQPKEIDSFIKYRDIWYASTTINCLQSIKIEEITQEKEGYEKDS